MVDRRTRLIGLAPGGDFRMDPPALREALKARQPSGKPERASGVAKAVAKQVEGAVQAPRVKPPRRKKK